MKHILFVMTLFIVTSYARDKVAFITGGSTGMGAATVKKFAENNIKVCFLDRDAVLGKALAKQFSPKSVIYIQGDVKNPSDIIKGIEQNIATFGGLDIVFANAGIGPIVLMKDASIDEWNDVMNTNFRGVYFTLKEAMPHLVNSGGGSVIISSGPCLDTDIYSMSKAGLDALTKNSARLFGPKNIRVNSISPGWVHTPLSNRLIAEKFAGTGMNKAQMWQAAAQSNPLRKTGKSDEVAELVYFLTTDAASYITGAVIPIDGGKRLR